MSNKKTTATKPKNGKDVVKEVLAEEVVHEVVTDNTPVDIYKTNSKNATLIARIEPLEINPLLRPKNEENTPSEPRVRTAQEIAESINAAK